MREEGKLLPESETCNARDASGRTRGREESFLLRSGGGLDCCCLMGAGPLRFPLAGGLFPAKL